jgi:hypothetical protein
MADSQTYVNQKYAKADLKEKGAVLKQIQNELKNDTLQFVSTGHPALDTSL